MNFDLKILCFSSPQPQTQQNSVSTYLMRTLLGTSCSDSKVTEVGLNSDFSFIMFTYMTTTTFFTYRFCLLCSHIWLLPHCLHSNLFYYLHILDYQSKFYIVISVYHVHTFIWFLLLYLWSCIFHKVQQKVLMTSWLEQNSICICCILDYCLFVLY